MPRLPSIFPPIEDYAFLSDCEVNCLISSSGNVEWMCLPRPDSPSIFGSILDRAAGSFLLAPHGVNVPVQRRYLPGSLMMETTWQTSTGWLIVRDALVMGPWHDNQERSQTHKRAPNDWDAEHILLRTARCVSGTVELAMSCEPTYNYAQIPARWEYSTAGYHQARCKAEGDNPIDDNGNPYPELLLTTTLRLGLENSEAIAHTRMSEGDTAFVALSWSPKIPPPQTWEEAADKIWNTTEFWRQWISIGQFPDHPWRAHLQRSALTLKGLTYSPTGALLAAATTSLPETIGGGRNWDYRYTWIRDSSFALWGLYTLGLNREANDFFSFISDIRSQDSAEQPLQVLYGVGGERSIKEQELSNLHGYLNSQPVRVGNAAYEQNQHDIWGTLLDSIYLNTKSNPCLTENLWSFVKEQITQVETHWRNTDRGIWEVRGPERHFTSSKIYCWVAADRATALAKKLGETDLVQRWSQLAEDIKADVLKHGVKDGIFTQHYDTKALDASLLLVPLLRFLPPDDPRVINTVLAIADNLTHEGLVLRYRTDQTDDGLQGEEGSFMICSFWLVSALVEIGHLSRAKSLLERLLSYASPLLLYAEELDPTTGHQLGNFPQAFTHLALINAVVHVLRAEETEDYHGSFEPF